MTFLTNAMMVILAYVIAHGITAVVITPLQMQVLPGITDFASLVYLPHGVRLLSVWLLGWRAVPALCIGAFLSELLFTPPEVSHATDPVILLSILAGALAAPIAFELFRLFGRSLYAGGSRRIHWQWLLLVGVVASVLNSLGQSLVFDHRILPGQGLSILVIYAVGDLIGLIVSALGLMMIFRWIRLAEGLDEV